MKEKSTKHLEKYEINSNTAAILPFHDKGLFSRVLEVEQEYVVTLSPKEIIENSCEYYGSSYDGRTKGTKAITGISHKPPIAIDPLNKIYFFPTHSPKRTQCAWISHRYVEEHGKIDSYKVIVTFANNMTIQLPISYNSFESQLHRTAYLRTKLLQRMKKNNIEDKN